MKKYWFKRKVYGWGWYPSTWQGFLVLLLFIIFAIILIKKSISYMIILVLLLVAICYKTGEKPRWQWGNK